jgi:hypothetical protein
MQPVVFLMVEMRTVRGGRGVGPSWQGAPSRVPAPPVQDPPHLQPVVFAMSEARAVRGGRLGVGPSWQGRIPLPATYQRLTGVSKDSSGSVLAGCTVMAFRTADNVFLGQTISDGNGNYDFRLPSLDAAYLVLYKAGAPDVAGTTVNTLVGGT